MSQKSEADRVRFEIIPYTKGKVLDIGAGPFRLYNHFITLDDMSEWEGGKWKPDIISDCHDLSLFATNSFNAVFSSFLLNRLENKEKALKEWWRVVKPYGYMILYLPLKRQDSPFETTSKDNEVSIQEVMDIMQNVHGKWDLVLRDIRVKDEYCFLLIFRKIVAKENIESWNVIKPRKTCGIVRYGGIGDMLMVSSVLPGLKEQGYHVTVHTGPDGIETIKNNPYLDEVFVNERFQIPNEDLGPYWNCLKTKYDKFINYSESVEGAWLAAPGRAPFNYWGKGVRQKYFNVNYLEFHHDLAGIPYDPKPFFYPTEHEKRWAEHTKNKLNGIVILWSVTGSALHKVWPYMDRTIAYLMMTYPDVKIVLSGGDFARMGEVGWENEPRVILTSGKWGVRKSLSFAQVADIVIGSETGLLNSVSHMDIPKIVMLSHSSKENLTRDWINCVTLEPENCECYPCHKMVYNWEHCNRNEDTGVSDCQSKIRFETVNRCFDMIIADIKRKENVV